MKRCLLILLFFAFCGRVSAQELQCLVNLNLQNLSTDDRKNWETFKQDVEAYLNAFSWTTNFQGDKIHATFNFNILPTGVQLFVQSKRPLYKSTEETVMARFLDGNVSFGYT